ncbi:hypothetical protein MHC_04200 [Mycoplasma haemocanis str. Illinois]|uniref:Uncharacterized protein n=1 Tax=Mycoplasma haemocanis (strain Illinois) TaxID=1111676 RepID=H6N7S4_MYCHN|nr:hypothetical protein [Mycoplasma haemocanis]AEW45696.1 hypothetical protein MHC_04200 [Mycoplasma haemocanis str. Illinois]
MSYKVIKMAILGSSASAIGGGLVSGYFALSEKDKIPQSSTPISKTSQKSCVIYDMEEPEGTINHRKFKKIKQKFEGKNAFLKALESKGNLWNKEELRKKVEAKCDQGEDSYIWWGKGYRPEETWIYARDMNENGVDWTKDSEVIKNSENILKK